MNDVCDCGREADLPSEHGYRCTVCIARSMAERERELSRD